MSSRWVRLLVAPALLLALLGGWSGAALAQESPPETFPEPEAEPTVERDIADTDDELRTAVIGLVGIAVVAFVLIILYWVHTGRAARRRFEAAYGSEYDYDGYYPYEESDEVGFYEQPPGWR